MGLDLSKEEAVDSTVLAKVSVLKQVMSVSTKLALISQPTRQEHFRSNAKSDELEAQLEAVCRDYPRSLTRALAFITSNVAVRREVLAKTQGLCPFWPGAKIRTWACS